MLLAVLTLNPMSIVAYTAATGPTKTALITGSTDGIGLTTAKQLASKGFNVIIHGRNPSRIQNAVKAVESHVTYHCQDILMTNIHSVESDISTVQGCKALTYKVQSILKTNKYSSLDVLMNNAGVFEADHILTEDHLEMTFAVNVMAPFVITSNLLPQLLSSDEQEDAQNQSRVVIASSMSQCRSIDHWNDLQCLQRSYSTHRAYSESKLLDAMLAAEFATRLANAGIGNESITCNSLDPGTVNTKMLLQGWGPCGIEVEDALDESYLCTSDSDDVQNTSGAYFCWKSVSRAADQYKPLERQKMWDVLSRIDPESAEKWNDITSQT